MKAISCLLGLLLLSAPAIARETAYKALRAFGAERGQMLLMRVVEVRGRAGTPQPDLWKIIIDDPNARGGVREVEVQNSQIIAEHTPLQVYGGVGKGAVMDFQKLSLDSEGAFKVANQEATNARFGFDSIDYTLRVADDSNVPVWALQFLDENQKSIGSIQIAADSGTVLVRSFGKPDADPGNANLIRTQPIEPVGNATEATDPEEIRRRPRIGHEIKKGILTAGAAMEEFFTGKRTIDRKYREPESPTPYLGDD